MKALIYRRPRLIGIILGLVLIAGLLGSTSAVHALNQGGGSSKSGGCANTYNICTNNGFGWQLFQTNGSTGEPNFFHVDSWATVSSQCSYAGGVYIFLVAGKAIPRTNTPYTEAYPISIVLPAWAPGDAYWNAHYSGDNYNTVYSDYITNLGSSPNRWTSSAHDLEWFCYNENPPWTINATAKVDRSVAEPGETVTWTTGITNGGASATNKAVPWHYVNSGSFPSGSGPVTTLPSGSAKGASQTSTSTYTPVSADIGKTFCRATTASPSSNNGGTTTTTPACVTIAEKPKVQVLGGDLGVGGGLLGAQGQTSNITTSISQQTIGGVLKTFGSWDEYGAQATGTISGYASGAALNGGLAGYSSCTASQLIFTSAGTAGCTMGTTLGNYTSATSLPDVADAFPTNTSTQIYTNGQTIPISDSAQRRVESATGTVTLTGGEVNKGDWLVINAPSATVNITSNLYYYSDDPMKSGETLNGIADIPQVIIIANCINIAAGVTQVDAWLVSTTTTANTGCPYMSGGQTFSEGGVLNTCGDASMGGAIAGGNLSTTICNGQLKVNGPVIATHLYLQRTTWGNSGTSTDDGTPAEVFNLRPDAYLWLANRSAVQGYIQTADTTELPPRF